MRLHIVCDGQGVMVSSSANDELAMNHENSISNMVNPEYYRVTLDFYRHMSGKSVLNLTDIPADQLMFMAPMEFIDMARPLSLWMLREGVPLKRVSDIYGVHAKTLHRWKDKYL